MHHSPQKPLLLTTWWTLHVATVLNWDARSLTHTHTHTHTVRGSTDSSCNDAHKSATQQAVLLGRQATATRGVLHILKADWKALAAVEACTDLWLPWLNRERGSCFIQDKRRALKGKSPLYGRGGATATPANQHSPEQRDWGRGGQVRGVVAKKPQCNPPHIQTPSLFELFHSRDEHNQALA